MTLIGLLWIITLLILFAPYAIPIGLMMFIIMIPWCFLLYRIDEKYHLEEKYLRPLNNELEDFIFMMVLIIPPFIIAALLYTFIFM